MANRLILNRVAIWRPKLNDGFSVRKSPSGEYILKITLQRLHKDLLIVMQKTIQSEKAKAP